MVKLWEPRVPRDIASLNLMWDVVFRGNPLPCVVYSCFDCCG